MKRNKSLLIFTIVFLAMLACIYVCYHHYAQEYHTMISKYEDQIKAYEHSEQVLLEQLEELQQEKDSIISELEMRTQELEMQTQELHEIEEKIANFHMQPPNSEDWKALSGKKMMSKENVPLRKIPSDNEDFYTGIILSYDNVKAHAMVVETMTDLQDPTWLSKDRNWVLVSIYTFGESVDSYGWVRLSELMEYNEDTMYLYQGPFFVSEDAIDLETGELAHSSLRGHYVSVEFMEDCAKVSTHGGIYCYVDKKYVTYPEP